MRISKSNIIKILIVIAIVASLLVVVFISVKKNNTIKTDYYYTFEYDDNLISQSVKVFDKNGKQKSEFYLFNGDRLITATKGDKAVLTIAELDLKEHPELYVVFANDLETKYEIVYKK